MLQDDKDPAEDLSVGWNNVVKMVVLDTIQRL